MVKKNPDKALRDFETSSEWQSSSSEWQSSDNLSLPTPTWREICSTK